VIISAQVSLYPLRQERLTPAIDAFLRALEREGIEAHVGPMSTMATGESERVFAALRAAFEQSARLGPAVMNVTFSNACSASEP
jgi:uncharacterized protein YqgV (UPF0045/DUF77 family)